MNETTTAPTAASETRLTGKQRKAIVAGAIGNTVEWVDWAVYATLAPVFAGQFFAKGDPGSGTLYPIRRQGRATMLDLGAPRFFHNVYEGNFDEI